MIELSADVREALAAEIAEAGGREVYFVAELGETGTVTVVRPIARGTSDSVLALPGVVENGTGYLYVDGVKQSQEADVRFVDTGDFAYIGKQYSNTDERYWVGAIDEVRIYNRALSATEIAGL